MAWKTTVADYKDGYFFTMAPLAVKGKIILGTSGPGEMWRGAMPHCALCRSPKRVSSFQSAPAYHVVTVNSPRLLIVRWNDCRAAVRHKQC